MSAIVGAPDAGTPALARCRRSRRCTPRPRSPRTSIEQTVIAQRRRVDWSLVPPSGAPIPLTRRGRDPRAPPGRRRRASPVRSSSRSRTARSPRPTRASSCATTAWYITDLDSTNGVLFATLMGTEVEAAAGRRGRGRRPVPARRRRGAADPERGVTDPVDDDTVRSPAGSRRKPSSEDGAPSDVDPDGITTTDRPSSRAASRGGVRSACTGRADARPRRASHRESTARRVPHGRVGAHARRQPRGVESVRAPEPVVVRPRGPRVPREPADVVDTAAAEAARRRRSRRIAAIVVVCGIRRSSSSRPPRWSSCWRRLRRGGARLTTPPPVAYH